MIRSCYTKKAHTNIEPRLCLWHTPEHTYSPRRLYSDSTAVDLSVSHHKTPKGLSWLSVIIPSWTLGTLQPGFEHSKHFPGYIGLTYKEMIAMLKSSNLTRWAAPKMNQRATDILVSWCRTQKSTSPFNPLLVVSIFIFLCIHLFWSDGTLDFTQAGRAMKEFTCLSLTSHKPTGLCRLIFWWMVRSTVMLISVGSMLPADMLLLIRWWLLLLLLLRTTMLLVWWLLLPATVLLVLWLLLPATMLLVWWLLLPATMLLVWWLLLPATMLLVWRLLLPATILCIWRLLLPATVLLVLWLLLPATMLLVLWLLLPATMLLVLWLLRMEAVKRIDIVCMAPGESTPQAQSMPKITNDMGYVRLQEG